MAISMTKPTSTPRVDTYRERQKALGRKRRPEMYLTDDEHEYLKQQLDAYRSNDEYKRDLIVGLNAIKKFISHMQECGFMGPPAMVCANQHIDEIESQIHIDE